jgi:peptidoglycan DL-endopeptidase LytE
MSVQQLAERRAPKSMEWPPAPLDRRMPLGRRVPAATIRRRQVVIGLAALAAIAVVAAWSSGVAAAWWAVVGVVGAEGAYLAMLHRDRRIRAERDFGRRFGSGYGDLSALIGTGLRAGKEDDFAAAVPVRAQARPGPAAEQAWAVVRFALACGAGWALSPLVFALGLLAREMPRDATSQRWLAHLEAAQERLREQSLRTIAVSAATTASVTAAGTMAVLGGPGAASATTVTASAHLVSAPLLSAAAPAANGLTGRYTVVAGDTLSAIAARFGTTTATLASANHLANPNLIIVGEVLAVPGGSPSQPAPTRSGLTGRYTVVAGDTLSAIAARFGTTTATLASANHLANPNLIIVGEVLAVPGGSPSVRGPSPAPVPASGAASLSGRYTVVAGDTLSAIAARFGTTTATLASANHLANPNLITVGEVLAVPGGSAVATPATETGVTRPAEPPASHPAPAPSSAGQIAAEVALAQVGKPYQWAGAGPNSFDCSGLVMYAWAHAGVNLPHYSVAQYEDTARISESQLQPGDLVFTDNGDGGAQPGHVTIYIGHGEIVTADMPGTVVRVETLNWDGVPMGFGRVR